MSQYSMTCTCGHVISVDAADRSAAVQAIQGIMTAEAIAAHMAERHPGQPVPPVSQVHAMIEMGVTAAA
jgi:hypothetical protein